MGCEAEHLATFAQRELAPSLPNDPGPATSSYFICGVPRGGTWLLAGLLASTDLAGHPHEWFWRGTEDANRARWGVASFDEYLLRAKEAGTAGNGVFAAKLMWGSMGSFLDRLRSLSRRAGTDERSLIERFFPRPRFVFVRRDDVVAQAVSWSRAIQTGRWHHWDSPPEHVSPRFDFEQIDALVAEAAAHYEAWRRWFAANGIEPLEILYEDLVDDPAGVTRGVLAFLGIAAPAELVVAAKTTRSGTAVNADWAARYLALRA